MAGDTINFDESSEKHEVTFVTLSSWGMDPVEIPSYMLSGQIKQLIGLTGLDTNNNEVHKNILNAFQTQTNELPILYNLWKPENEPPKGEKQIFRSPKGIIKRDWPLKYLQHRPAVVVLFVDLNWDHPNWAEKRVEVESKVASLRQSVPIKEIKIALVLIQTSNSSSLSPDDYLAKDRSKELWESCQLSDKQVFVFPDYEPFNAVVRRMENGLYELGQTFYQAVLRRIRGRSIPNNYPNLTIRQQFKLGFLSEMRQDTYSALRPYRQAYQHCSDTEVQDTELFEYLSVVSLLNYKICELSFIHNLVNEAITQFRKFNTSFFNRRAGYYPSPELAEIEMGKWKSQQCRLFADLFSHAITKGLAAYPYQNPGLQLDMSADFLCHVNARIVALKATLGQQELASMHNEILNFPTEGTYPIYLGQRPWRAKNHLNSQLDPLTEHAAKQALEITCQPNHQQSLTLFSAAMRNFQIFKCNRMQRTVLLKMADEYFNLRRFQKSMQVLVHVVYELRRENVNQILFPILQRCLDASYCDVDAKDYIWTVSQLINPTVIFSTINQPYYVQLKAQLEENFNNIINGVPPKTHSSLYARLTQDEIDQIERKWKELYTTEFDFTVNVTRLDPHLQAVAVFLPKEGKTINSGDHVIVQVSVKSSSSTPYHFTSLQAQIEEHGLTRSTSPPILPSQTLKRENVQIPPNTTTDFFFETTLDDQGPPREKAFQVTHIRLEFNTQNGRIKGLLEFENTLQNMVPATSKSLLRSVFTGDIGVHVIRALPTKPKLELVWPETDIIYTDAENKLKFKLKNNETSALKNVKVICRQLDSEEIQPDDFVFPSVLFDEHSQKQPRLTKDIAPYLSPGTEIDFTLNCFAKCPFNSQIQVRVQATTEDPRYSEGLIESAFSMKFIGQRPFVNKTVLYASNDEHISFLIQGHTTRLECACTMETDIEIVEGHFTLTEDLVLVTNKSLNVPEGIQPAKSIVKFGAMIKAPTILPITSEVDMGKIVLKWKRSDDQKVNESSLLLGRVHIQQCPLKVEPVISGSSHVMRKLIEMEYQLHNLTERALHFKVSVERADSLMFSGYTEKFVHLSPCSNESLRIAVIALGAGQLQIPRLQIAFQDPELDQLVQKYALGYLKSTIFVTVS